MKRHSRIGAFVAGCVIALTCAPAHAYYNSQQPNESDLDNHRHYRNHDGNVIHSPARSRSGVVPEGASAQCRDGTYSFSQHHSGTCSRHGGVARWQ
ncbi:DUF3761 domain-containing protein [Caballeronia sp. LZ062]|uniref:DUF3761 domain-containing protein n=1 Tax=unclassified Caballeronia TaxID=2646786 RepID=UPI0028569988|nr:MULTISPECIES: DUF3761 domain-containing protein [unclassified Caballeronia]MDR5855520.1 DUF3761 domain-containing protein [Caballeronia sp. LZ050]MDR5869954.1 DUF3761 domain-containing protein [Caballeronia sp. LZ062]